MENKKYEGQSGTQFGCLLRWRLKEGVTTVVCNLAEKLPTKEWSKAPYLVSDLILPENINKTLISPKIKKWDDELAKHDLVRHDVALAIQACLVTALDKEILDVVEWRITKMKLETSYAITFDEDEE